jgi:hypothetical protein
MYPLPENPEPEPTSPRPPRSRSIPLSAPLPADVLPPRTSPSMAATDPLGSETSPFFTSKPAPAARDTPPPRPTPPLSSDAQRARIRDDMEALRLRAADASSWLESSGHYARLINQSGVVPVNARLRAGDLTFLAEAREQMLRFADLTVRLIDLHQPLDAGGITSDPSSPILRCRSCMWRWPCPTFSILTEILDRPVPS